MVFQNYALYPHLSVYDNMAFALKLRKMPKDEIDKKVKEAAKILDLEKVLDRKPKALSGGQRQRVALGRAIVRNPQVFLMDEPLSNLDAKLRTSMRTEISKLHKSLGTTFIYVTHDQVEAMTMADRIVVMKDGIVQQIATPQEIYDHPANIFVAGFIGAPQMNFINVKIEEKNGEIYAVNEQINIHLSKGKCQPLVKNGYVGKEVVLGIRPEDIHIEDLFIDNSLDTTFEAEVLSKGKCQPLVKNGYVGKEVVLGIRPEDIHIEDLFIDNSLDTTFEAEVEISELMGAEIYAYLKLGDSTVTARFDGRYRVRFGDKIKLAMDKEHLHIFDKETELTII